MWPGVVVVIFPGRQHGSNPRKRGKQCLIEEFVAQADVETLDERVLGRLAGRDVVPLDLPPLAEAQHGHSGKLGSVVGHAHRRSTAPGNDDIKLTYDPQTRQRGIGDERQAFTGEVVDNAAPWPRVPVCARRAGKLAAVPRDRDDETSYGS